LLAVLVSHRRCRNTGAIILYVIYGWKVTDNDPLVSMLQATFDTTAKINVPGRWWVEGMPFCRSPFHFPSYYKTKLVGLLRVRFLPSWFPGAGFKRTAIEHGKRMSRVDTVPFNWTKQQIVSLVKKFCEFLLSGILTNCRRRSAKR
jgi:hypothetical protein